MFKKLFRQISSISKNDSMRDIYNQGVTALARGDVSEAKYLFEQICEEHPSAAYNLGLIYLDGAGEFTPRYSLARKYLKLADQLGHERAVISAQVIGLDGIRNLTKEESQKFYLLGVKQYSAGRQFGNLAYIIAQHIIQTILGFREHQYSLGSQLNRFLSYELYCIHYYGDENVMKLYNNSSLTDFSIDYQDEWKNGEVAEISETLNQLMFLTAKYIGVELSELGVVRLSVVNRLYEYYSGIET